MNSLQYDPKDDWRECLDARYVPLPTVTNPDVVGVTVSLAGESRSPWRYLPLGYELTDSSLCHHHLFPWVQVLAWISLRKRTNIRSASRNSDNFVPRRPRNRIHSHHRAVVLHPSWGAVLYQPPTAISLRCEPRTLTRLVSPRGGGCAHLHRGSFRLSTRSH